MKNTFLIFFIIVSLIYPKGKEDKIRLLIDKYSELNLFNGAVLVADSSGIILNDFWGKSDFQDGADFTAESQFRIGSITKQFTAFAIMQLVEIGKISLDGKLSNYIEYYRKDIGEKVLIKHLLNHTSGIPSYTNNPDVFEKIFNSDLPQRNFIIEYCSGNLEFEPGEEYVYNNSGYYLLGVIIEKITGVSLRDYLNKNIFELAKMINTELETKNSGKMNLVKGYEPDLFEKIPAPEINMDVPAGAGAIVSTCEDLYRWSNLILNKNILTKDSYEKIFSPGKGNYGFGWIITDQVINNDSVTIYQHGGGIPGFTSLLTIVPQKKQVIIILSNYTGSKLNQLNTGLFNLLYGVEPEYPKIPAGDFLYQNLKENSIDEIIKIYNEIKHSQDIFSIKESELKKLGEYLINSERYNDAVDILELSRSEFPKSFLTLKQLAKAHDLAGEEETAISLYKEYIEIINNDDEIIIRLKELGVETDSVLVINLKNELLIKYVGNYQLFPDFVLTISVEGDRIFLRGTGQPRTEIFPKTETRFFSKIVSAVIEFNLDKSGNPTGLTLIQNGAELKARKL